MDQLQVLEANKAKSTLGGVSASPGTSNRYPPQQANNTSQDATLGTNFKDQKPQAEDQIALVDKAQQQDAEKFFLTGVNVNTKGVGQNETSDKYEVHDVLQDDLNEMAVPEIDPEMASSEEVNRYKLIAVVDSSRTISNNEVSFRVLKGFQFFER